MWQPMDSRKGSLRTDLALLLLGSWLMAWPAGAGDWSVFRGDARLSGVARDPLPDKLEPLWVFEAEEGFESAATIQSGQVFAGSLDGNLYVIDLDSG